MPKKIYPIKCEILTCECGAKYIAFEGDDNEYNCRICYKDLTHTAPQEYTIKPQDLASLIEKNFQGKQGKSYAE